MRETIFFYWQRQKKICFFLALLFLLGFFIGAIGSSHFLPQDKAEDIHNMAQQVITQLPLFTIDYSLETKDAFVANAYFILLVWFLGLTVIGIPFLFLLVLAKGISLGVATSLLISGNGMPGFLVALLNVLPLFILLIPLLSITVSWALRFSGNIWQGYFSNGTELAGGILAYTGVFFILAVGWLMLAYVQGFLTPALTKGFLSLL